MVKSEQKRQQKLARKKAKDRKRHQQAIQQRQSLSSLHGQMLSSAGGSIVYCGATDDVKNGMGSVCLARRAPTGEVAMFLLLVDTLCLGVKNAMGRLQGGDDFRNMVEKLGLVPIKPEIAKGLVDTAIEFAAKAGLKPHADYQRVQPLWGDISRGSIEGIYEMGSNGKHVYMNGPFEDLARQQYILSTLRAHLGVDNFHFVLGSSPERAHFDIDDYADDDDNFDGDAIYDASDDDAIDASSYRRIDSGEPT